MSDLNIRIIDHDLDTAISELSRIDARLSAMHLVTDALSEAVGEPRLATTVESFTSSWRIKREELVTMVRAHRAALEAVRSWSDTIDDVEVIGDDPGKSGTPPEAEQAPQSEPQPDSLPDAPQRHGPSTQSPAASSGDGATGHGSVTGGGAAPALGATRVDDVAPQRAVGRGAPAAVLDVVGIEASAARTGQVGATGVDAVLESYEDPALQRIREILGDLVDMSLDAELSEAQLARVAAVGGVGTLAALVLASRAGAGAGAGAGDAAPRGASTDDSVTSLRDLLRNSGTGAQEPKSPACLDRETILRGLVGPIPPAQPVVAQGEAAGSEQVQVEEQPRQGALPGGLGTVAGQAAPGPGSGAEAKGREAEAARLRERLRSLQITERTTR